MSGIVVKSYKEVEGIRKAGRLLAEVLDTARAACVPGRTTSELNDIIEGYILSHGAKPTFKGYRGFPAASCISLNHEVIHGIPGARRIKEGDLVKIDAGVTRKGFIADSAITVPVGEPSGEARALIEVTREALAAAVEYVRDGNRVGDLSNAIFETANKAGFEVVRDYFGHGTGIALHEEPNIPNFGQKGVGPLLQKGMTIAIEPMLNLGTGRVKLMDDNWTVVTADSRLSAHFEHTVAVTENGCEILTTNV
ncbi:type I methionyl aminopeptidase [candidate division WOR-3 bacterium]|uniref:Methionine aminopeptidase n=1 Tax=candidate division WOR-3 bacterium TaxID=2052148 RepID=A0A9D5QDD1_UNCW3|nr:type I methionyl aminopeptidase [candidate division WOR-3 bacterium]MBD3365638.1 type I methionyl aminopeptidase [candidate division WOR-3 bacterium]